MSRAGSTVINSGQNKSNLIANGGFEFAQRKPSGNSPLTSIGGNYLIGDRWLVGSSGVTTPTAQRTGNAVVGPLVSRFQGSSSGTYGVGGELIYRQRIESIFTRDLALGLKRISFGFWANSTGPERIDVGLAYPAGLDTWASSTTFFSASDTLTVGAFKYFRFENIPAHANCVNGMRLDISYRSVAFSGGADIHLTEVMLNEGLSVAPFNRHGNSYQNELHLCLRYYEKTYRLETAPGSGAASAGAVQERWGVAPGSSDEFVFRWWFKAPKRVVPVVIGWNPSTGVQGQMSRDSGGAIGAQVQASGTSEFHTAMTNSTASDSSVHRLHMTAEAEL